MSADWQAVLERTGLLDALAAFDPHVAGTFPLDLAVAGSDIDLVCEARDLRRFARAVWEDYAHWPGFALLQWCEAPHAVVARFMAQGLPVEIFASPQPVSEQAGWLHFCVEQRLLRLGGAEFHAALRAMRAQGWKTEPAFARVLGLTGDPYAVLLELARAGDAKLQDVLDRRK